MTCPKHFLHDEHYDCQVSCQWPLRFGKKPLKYTRPSPPPPPTPLHVKQTWNFPCKIGFNYFTSYEKLSGPIRAKIFGCVLGMWQKLKWQNNFSCNLFRVKPFFNWTIRLIYALCPGVALTSGLMYFIWIVMNTYNALPSEAHLNFVMIQ